MQQSHRDDQATSSARSRIYKHVVMDTRHAMQDNSVRQVQGAYGATFEKEAKVE